MPYARFAHMRVVVPNATLEPMRALATHYWPARMHWAYLLLCYRTTQVELRGLQHRRTTGLLDSLGSTAGRMPVEQLADGPGLTPRQADCTTTRPAGAGQRKQSDRS